MNISPLVTTLPLNSKPVPHTSPQKITTDTFSTSSDDKVSISDAGKQAAMLDRYRVTEQNVKSAESKNTQLSQQEHTLGTMIPIAEGNPKVAKKLAYDIAFSTDLMFVNLEAIKDDPYKMAEAGAMANEFDKVAPKITQQRVAMYNSMKAEGASDVDIIKALVKLNKSLPESYQLQAGMFKHQVSGHL